MGLKYFRETWPNPRVEQPGVYNYYVRLRCINWDEAMKQANPCASRGLGLQVMTRGPNERELSTRQLVPLSNFVDSSVYRGSWVLVKCLVTEPAINRSSVHTRNVRDVERDAENYFERLNHHKLFLFFFWVRKSPWA